MEVPVNLVTSKLRQKITQSILIEEVFNNLNIDYDTHPFDIHGSDESSTHRKDSELILLLCLRTIL